MMEEQQSIQKSAIDAINVLIDERIRDASATVSKVGLVKSDPTGFGVTVEINDSNYSCVLPEHLHSWIREGDIVVVQDLYGDGRQKIITGRLGSTLFDDNVEKEAFRGGSSHSNKPIFSQQFTEHSVTWSVNHNLGYTPIPVTLDELGNEVVGSVEHIDNNNLKITFSEPIIGEVIIYNREGTIEFLQKDPSTVWIINHNLGYRPIVSLLDGNGVVITGAIKHLDRNKVQVTFNEETTGYCLVQ